MLNLAVLDLARTGCAMLALSTAWAEAATVAPAADVVSIITAADATWMPGPTAFPLGLELSVLQGDPSKEGPFVVRLRVPAGYQIPAHTHGGAEHVTIISGDLSVGTGTTFATNALRALSAGDFISIPANVPHFATSEGGTVMQVHGLGPLTITCLADEHGAHAPAK